MDIPSLIKFIDSPEEEIVEEKNLCVIRLRTSCWRDSQGLHMNKDFNYLRRRSRGYNILDEDAMNIGADDTIAMIVGLHNYPDGVYLVTTCNEYRDWETGCIEDYDLHLTPLEDEK